MINAAYEQRISELMAHEHRDTKPAIYFDLDGTICNLYGVPDWLAKLTSADVSPYIEAMPIGSPEELKAVLDGLRRRGYHLGVVSWCAKGGTREYNQRTRQAKKAWLAKYYPNTFQEIHIVKYGTPKHKVTKRPGILVDDNEAVRRAWGSRTIDASDFSNILKNLKILLDFTAQNRNTVFNG